MKKQPPGISFDFDESTGEAVGTFVPEPEENRPSHHVDRLHRIARAVSRLNADLDEERDPDRCIALVERMGRLERLAARLIAETPTSGNPLTSLSAKQVRQLGRLEDFFRGKGALPEA